MIYQFAAKKVDHIRLVSSKMADLIHDLWFILQKTGDWLGNQRFSALRSDSAGQWIMERDIEKD
jgi:hypothetical protein